MGRAISKFVFEKEGTVPVMFFTWARNKTQAYKHLVRTTGEKEAKTWHLKEKLQGVVK